MRKIAANPKAVDTGTHFLDGNHAVTEGGLVSGANFFAAYPITPSTEIAELFAERIPKIGGIFIQMEDEIAALAANIGAVWGGAKVMTTTSGPGFSLMMENIGLAVMMEVPMVITNVQRAGPSTGLPTYVAQQDMMQVRWGSHGDYEIIALCPDSPQECFDLTIEAFNLSETYRVPVFIMIDECIGHMHEKVVIPEAKDINVLDRRWYDGPKGQYKPYKVGKDGIAPMAKAGDGHHMHATGLTHDERGYPALTVAQQKIVIPHLIDKIKNNADKIIKLEETDVKGAEVVVMSYGITSRVAVRAVQLAKEAGIKVGSIRLITAWPFPEKRIKEVAKDVKAIIFPEINMGQMVLEAERCAGGQCKVVSIPHPGGDVHDPDDIVAAIKEAIK
ncbi:MAG TPA: 2-oxoacid:acceptor oxidoreductase subunit alpha [Rhodospirillales bacterium]|nr:2-oxoacid:acceptor oxidoreductase subunit alpha [Rhodospirillales bacterium]